MVVSFFLFSPLFGEDEPNLTSIFFKWDETTTNQLTNWDHPPSMKQFVRRVSSFELANRLICHIYPLSKAMIFLFPRSDIPSLEIIDTIPLPRKIQDRFIDSKRWWFGNSLYISGFKIGFILDSHMLNFLGRVSIYILKFPQDGPLLVINGVT